MINLLPTDTKQSLSYARHNTKLLRWLIVMLLSIIGITIVIVFGQIYINRSVNSYTKQVEQAREQLKVQKLEETQTRVEDITSSLKLVLQVLSREVLFSKLIRQVGSAMPEDTVLTNLQIGKVEGGIDLDAVAVDYQTGTQIQVNLQDPSNKIFDKADIVSISCNPPVAGTGSTANQQISSKYPCQVRIRALFTKSNPFLFTNQKALPTQESQP